MKPTFGPMCFTVAIVASEITREVMQIAGYYHDGDGRTGLCRLLVKPLSAMCLG
jgi:hypothetical protein